MSGKTFVIDTNVFLHDPNVLEKFENQRIIIPIGVLEELDAKKRLPNNLGKNARDVIRYLDSLKDGQGNLHEGVKTGTGSEITIMVEKQNGANLDLSGSINDNKIILSAHYLAEKGENVVFVSKDIAARVKAEAIGLEAEDYENLKYSYEQIHAGIHEVDVDKAVIDSFYKNGEIELEVPNLVTNQYCVMKSAEKSSAVGRFDGKLKKIVPLRVGDSTWGIKHRNVEQKCALDMLLNDDINLISLVGPAGTGKTLLALACALKKVFDDGSYNRILVSRPIVPLGRDIGYLPGTKDEKLFHWMQPIYDNLEFLCGASKDSAEETLKWIMESKKLEMEAVTYIRGRSLPKIFMIIDEAQNLTPHEVKTIISRAGEGTKVVLAGDPTQLDNPYLDKDSNGLTYTCGTFRGNSLYGQMFMSKTERSMLAAAAAELM